MIRATTRPSVKPSVSPDGFFVTLSDILIGLVDSTGGPIVIILAMGALVIIGYAVVALYKMCREELRADEQRKLEAQTLGRRLLNAGHFAVVRKPLPRRVYEIQAEEGVLDGLLVDVDMTDPLDVAKISTVWKPAVPLEAYLEFDQRFALKKNKKGLFACLGSSTETADYV